MKRRIGIKSDVDNLRRIWQKRVNCVDYSTVSFKFPVSKLKELPFLKNFISSRMENLFVGFFVFLFFKGCTLSIWKFPG